MNTRLLALYGLKWNPFAPAVPTEALHVAPRLQSLCWRVQQLAGDGGFALVTGAPGTGKSAALRILAAALAAQRDVTVGVISRPQANIADFYREMGDLFGVELRPHNRWGGTKLLRQRWQAHIDAALSRPVLIVDEAQEMQSAVLAELRLLASADLDAHTLLTIVLAGDGRLAERLRADDVARDAAGVALRQYGRMAVREVAAAATDRDMRGGAETESSRRRRRAALEVLCALGAAAELSPSQRAAWMQDDDPEIAVRGCRLACACGAPRERERAVQRLLGLLPAVAWYMREAIENCLVGCGTEARAMVQSAVPATPPDAADVSPVAAMQRSLLRVARRLAA